MIIIPIALVVMALLIVTGTFRRDVFKSAPPRECGLREVDALWAMMAFACGALLAGDILHGLGLGAAKGTLLSDERYAWRNLVSQCLTGGVVMVFVLVRLTTPSAAQTSRERLSKFGLAGDNAMREVKWGLPALLIVLVLVSATMIFAQLVTRAFGFPPPEMIAHEMLKVLRNSESITAQAVIITSAVVLAPVFEEIMYRGVIQTSLLRLFGQNRRWMIILCASFVFTMVHFGMPSQALSGIFVLALILGYLYERTGSLWPSIIVHAGFNLVNIVLTLVQQVD